MKVSIIIPVYNVAPYVEECIRSVMNQTMTEGVECIIVDDCGQDNSMEIVERLVAEYKGNIEFHILHHDHNRGLSAARNTGIDAARGEYLYFLDSDDWIVPECIELMLCCVKNHPESQIVFAGAEVINGEHEWLDYTKKKLPVCSKDRDWLQNSMLKRYVFGMTAWNKLVLRNLILKNRLYFVEGVIHEDEIWNFQLSSFVEKASFLNCNTYVYRLRERSITSSTSEDIRWKRLMFVWNKMTDRVSGYRRDYQIKGICSFILEKTKWNFPWKYRMGLSILFVKLSFKAFNYLSPYLFIQGILAFSYVKKYSNKKNCCRITL